MKTLLTLILLLSLILPASGQNVAVGPGTTTCAIFIERIKQDANWENIYYSWTVGFLSASNLAMFSQKGQYRVIDAFSAEENVSILRTYCISHPEAMYIQALDYLMGKLPFSSK